MKKVSFVERAHKFDIEIIDNFMCACMMRGEEDSPLKRLAAKQRAMFMRRRDEKDFALMSDEKSETAPEITISKSAPAPQAAVLA